MFMRGLRSNGLITRSNFITTQFFSTSRIIFNDKKSTDQLLDLFTTPNNKDNEIEKNLFGFLNQKDRSSNIESKVMHPRDVAKRIKITGPLAGRTINVTNNNVGASLKMLNSVIMSNKIRYLQRIQSRYIRPAKYRKQLKREWWRRKFSEEFKKLLAKVNDAKRKGY
ncbi:37S ribosomal protein Mrp21p, mitochondrial [[Candida] jaroonii]|uniref:37S ribosomal protein Mrp21p, mitochondrial n=1 Tax=[Candida] jaroonii TaxID=467808 RepID=A0ACA9Y0N5_9ASCO|nr:37S ribosomal protein Mrp21p, mitochondrial [[Candida] jaroonii]